MLIMSISTYNWGSENCGGVDSVCQMYAEYLVSHTDVNLRYTIIGLDPQSKKSFTGEVIKLADNVDFIWLPESSKQTGLKIPGIIWQNWHLRGLLKKIRPDLVHTHFWNNLMCCGYEGKTIVTIHGHKKIGRNDFGFFNNLLYEKIIPLFTKHLGDKKIVVGDVLKKTLAQSNIDAEIIYNPIDYNFFDNELVEKPNKVNKPIKFITCAIINPKKNIEQSIDIIYQLNQDGFACHLNIVGSVANKKYIQTLKQKIKRLQLEQSVSFLGKKNKFELIELYKGSDCGIFTSKEETFGLVPIEMVASGLPLISTEVGILSEKKQFFECLGVLYLTNTTTSAQILRCISQFNRTESVRKLKSLFDVEEIMAQYRTLYLNILTNKS